MNKTQMRPLGNVPVFNDNSNFHILKSPCMKRWNVMYYLKILNLNDEWRLNPLSTNFTKWSNTLKQRLAFKGLITE